MGGMVAEEIVGSRGIAQLAGVSQRTARRWLASGNLPVLPAPQGAHRRVSMQRLRERLLEIVQQRQVEAEE